MADIFNGSYKFINSPAVAKSVEVYNALLNQQQIKEAVEKANTLDVVIQGIGSLNESYSSLQRSGYLTEKEREEYLNSGAVGHILSKVIDFEGGEIENFNNKVVGCPLSVLQNTDGL